MPSSLVLIVSCFLTIISCNEKKVLAEKDYIDLIQEELGGQIEVSVTSGRADLVVGEKVYEVEWASNWKESIGQSLWYGLQLDKSPGIILIMKEEKDYKYFLQLNSALEYAQIEIEVLRFPDDFD